MMYMWSKHWKLWVIVVVFFFQAEDGIRDVAVTGVQTCALPISEVMMAIRRRGMLLPNSVRPKTSLGLGQGSVVDMRTVMYEIRKQLKMKVSLRRKIHIIALPQGTFLNARWSEDQSATMPWMPSGNATGSAVLV